MTKKNQDAEMYVGKDYSVEFTEVDADDLASFNDLNYAFADNQYASSNIFEKSKSGGGITVSGSNDEIAEVSVDASDTKDLEPATYYHELETVDSNGDAQVAAEGEVTLLPSRTN